jgi:prepilin peptidase CpaA
MGTHRAVAEGSALNHTLLIIFALIFVCCLFYAIISDFTQLRIPNSVSIMLVAAFAVFAALGGAGRLWPEVALHLMIAAVVFAIFFAFFVMGWMKAGDVKLIGALMLWAGPVQGPQFVVLFAIFGGVFAVGLLALRYALPYFPILSDIPVMSKLSHWSRRGICPYGIPICIAALCVAPSIFAFH